MVIYLYAILYIDLSGMKNLRGFADFRDLLYLAMNVKQKGIWLYSNMRDFPSYITLNVIRTIKDNQ